MAQVLHLVVVLVLDLAVERHDDAGVDAELLEVLGQCTHDVGQTAHLHERRAFGCSNEHARNIRVVQLHLLCNLLRQRLGSGLQLRLWLGRRRRLRLGRRRRLGLGLGLGFNCRLGLGIRFGFWLGFGFGFNCRLGLGLDSFRNRDIGIGFDFGSLCGFRRNLGCGLGFARSPSLRLGFAFDNGLGSLAGRLLASALHIGFGFLGLGPCRLPCGRFPRSRLLRSRLLGACLLRRFPCNHAQTPRSKKSPLGSSRRFSSP